MGIVVSVGVGLFFGIWPANKAAPPGPGGGVEIRVTLAPPASLWLGGGIHVGERLVGALAELAFHTGG